MTVELGRKDDVCVGCITNYDFDAIRPWVNSLDRCGFEGHKVVIVYNIKKEVVDELTSRGYTVLGFNQNEEGGDFYYKQNFSIVVERFFHIWAMFKELKGQHRYLIHTDVKDVIFQRNPSEWLEGANDVWKDCRIIAGSESIKYSDEVWGRDNMQQSFGPLMLEYMKDKTIVNAGTLAGDFDTMIDLFLNVYMVSVGGKTHNPDQAAVNILLSQKPYSDVTRIAKPFHAWCVQAGTTHDPSKIVAYEPLLTDQYAIDSYIGGDGIVKNKLGETFVMVHQYDRVPHWKSAILEKYNG